MNCCPDEPQCGDFILNSVSKKKREKTQDDVYQTRNIGIHTKFHWAESLKRKKLVFHLQSSETWDRFKRLLT